MKFKKNTGSKLKSLKKEIEECNIDIKVVEENFDVEPLLINKDTKNITINNNKIELNDSYYKYFTLFKIYSKYIKTLQKEYDLTAKYENGLKNYDLHLLARYLEKEAKYFMGTYILYNDEKNNHMVSFTKDYGEIIQKLIQEIQTKERDLVNRLHGALDKLESDYQHANNKAIGREAGWLYGTRTYGGAAVGTFLTTATLEADQEKAQSTYRNSVTRLSMERNAFFERLTSSIFYKVMFACFDALFEDEISKEDLKEIQYILTETDKITPKQKVNYFYKYPFIMDTYSSALHDIKGDDYKALGEIIEYFDSKKEVIDYLKNITNRDFDNILAKDNISKSDFETNEFLFYKYLTQNENSLDSLIKNYFESFALDIMYYHEQRLTVMCEKLGRLNSIKDIISKDTYDEINRLFIKRHPAKNEVDAKVYRSEKYKITVGIIVSILLLVFLLISEPFTGGSLFRNLAISAVVGVGVYFAYYGLDMALISNCDDNYTNPTVINWFNLKGNVKRRRYIRIIFYVIIILIGILIYSNGTGSLDSRLDIYNSAWGYNSKYYLKFDKNGTLTVADEKRNRADQYKCNINQGKKENDKDWYDTHGTMSCNIDGETINIKIRTVIYKKWVEETHLYLECKSRNCPLWADSGSLSYDATKYFPNH